MQEVILTKRFEFSGSHRYYRPQWSEEENQRVFGPNSRPHGHGHNYTLEVSVAGRLDEATGMVMNIVDLKATVLEVLKEFDHKNLNADTPYFKERIPTTENIALVLWELINQRLKNGALRAIRLYEDEDLFVEYHGE